MTDEQKKIRLGLFSGSEIHKLMGKEGFGKTGKTYINEKVCEFLTGVPAKPEFTAASTTWGIEHEDEARKYFEAATGDTVTTCDTIVDTANHVCGTPDGVIDGQECGFEIKCPYNSTNHLKNFQMNSQADLLKLRPEYYWQCVTYMWITGLNEWKFCSYDPRFPDGKKMLILNLEQDTAHLELLKSRVLEAKLIFDNIVKTMEG